MTFALSARSLSRLKGVDPRLVAVVKRAIELTTVDFTVSEGLRSPARQEELFNQGASQIRVGGKHVVGLAVDLVAILQGRASWELNLYDNIAEAMRAAAFEQRVPLRWGAAWNVPDIRLWPGTMEEAMNFYIDARRKEGNRAFIDAPHFEITTSSLR